MRHYSIGVFFNVLSHKQQVWRENLNFVSRLPNVEHIELWTEYVPTSKNEIEFFIRLGQHFTFLVHAPFLDLTFLSPTQEIVDASVVKFSQAYEFAQRIDARVFTIHAGLMPSYWSEKVVLAKMKQGIKKLQGLSKMPICIENMAVKKSIQIPYPSTAAQIHNVARLSPLTLDIGHCMKGGVDPFPLLKRHVSVIDNIHIHNVRDGHDHVSLESGELNLKKFLIVLDELQYDKFLTLEVVGQKGIESSWKILQGLL